MRRPWLWSAPIVIAGALAGLGGHPRVLAHAAGFTALALALELAWRGNGVRTPVYRRHLMIFGLMALLGGGFSGIYALGMFTRRANWQGCVIGIVASIVMTVAAKYGTSLHVLMYGVVSISACMVFGYLGSLFFPAPTQSLRGLTIFDQLKAPIDPAQVRGH